MKLDRNINPNGKGKYALVKLRELPDNIETKEQLVEAILKNPDCIDLGLVGTDREFFVIRITDKYAPAALEAYAREAWLDDVEYAKEINAMAIRALATASKKPD